MRWTAALFMVLVAFLSMGATDCDQFHEVTVPANDSSPPLAVGSAYQLFLGGNFPEASAEALMHSWEADGGTLYRYSGPRIPLAAVASSIDDGGAKRVRMTGVMRHDCCRLSGGAWSACQRLTTNVSHEDEQEGSVGSRVSSGVYVEQVFTEPTQCPSGKQTRRLEFEFRVSASDFRGNQSASGPHRIIWDGPID